MNLKATLTRSVPLLAEPGLDGVCFCDFVFRFRQKFLRHLQVRLHHADVADSEVEDGRRVLVTFPWKTKFKCSFYNSVYIQ